MNEALKIAEDRTKAAIAEKEKFGDKNREMIFKMQSMQDEIRDKDFQVGEQQIRMNLLRGENEFLTKTKDSLEKKINQIYETNILISKEGDKEGEKKETKEEEEQN